MSGSITGNESAAFFKVPTLTGLDDFAQWKSAMTDSLLMLGALDIVEGTEPRLLAIKYEDGKETVEDKKEVNSWNERNRKAMAIMRRTVSDALKVDIEDCRSAMEIWDRLCELHDLTAPEYRAEIKRDILNHFLLEGSDFKAHLDGFLRLLHKASGAGIKYSDEDKCLMFLDSLPASFDMLKLQWRLMPESQKNFVELRRQYNLEGAQRARTQNRNTAAVMMANQVSDRKQWNKRSSKQAHLENRKSERKQEQARDMSKIRCYKCNKTGHVKKDCPVNQGSRRHQGFDDSNNHTYLSGPTGPFIGMTHQITVNPTEGVATAMGATAATGLLWVIDSGATHHIVNDEGLLGNSRHLSSPLLFGLAAEGRTMKAEAVGEVQVRTEEGADIILKDVHYVAEARVNLLSARVLVRRGWEVSLKRGASYIKIGALTLTLADKGDLFCLEMPYGGVKMQKSERLVAVAHKVAAVPTLTELHERFGHIGKTTIKNLVRNKTIEGLEMAEDVVSDFCSTCQKAKSTRLTFGDTTLRGTWPMELIHSDVAGPLQMYTMGNRFYVTLIDDYTGMTLAMAIPGKGVVAERLVGWIQLLENACGTKAHVLRTDGGGEYTSKAFQTWLSGRGMVHQVTPPYTPQHNGVAERKNRTIKEMVSAMMIDSGIPMSMWDWALQYSMIIQLTLTVRDGVSAWERIFKRKVDLWMIQPFGCTAWVHTPAQTREKSDFTVAKSVCGRYLGLTMDGGAAVWERETGKVHVSRDIIFEPRKDVREEDQVTYGDHSPTQDTEVIEQVEPEFVALEDEHLEIQPSDKADGELTSVEDKTGPVDKAPVSGQQDVAVEAQEEQGQDVSNVHNSDEPAHETPEPEHTPAQGSDGVGQKRGRDEEEPIEVVVRPVHVQEPRWKRPEAPTRKLPPRRAVSGRQAQANVTVVEPGEEPTTHRQAMLAPDGKEWAKAEQVELGNHERAGTWKPTKLPAGRKAVSSRWIYKRKTNSEGQVVKYKARVVARGFSQKPGLDYEETHAPTPALTALRCFVAIAIRYAMIIHQMDVEAAFLNSLMDVELYLEPPEGLDLPKGCDTLLVLRGLYGFKQSARLWWKAAHEHIVSLRFQQLTTEWCIYRRDGAKGTAYLLIYVDDMLVAATTQAEVDEIKAALKEKWRMTDLGSVSWVLGMSVERSTGGAFLSQSAYINSLVRKFDQEKGRTVCTPLPVDLPAKDGVPFGDRSRYQAMVGSLLWLAVSTRPDVAFAAGYLGRYNAEPTHEHWEVGMRVIRYLKTTHDVGLYFGRSPDAPHIEGWVDADHAGDKDTRKSTTGYAFKVFGCLVSWGARRQDIVATSTVHAEYVAMSEAARENAYLRTLMNDLGYGSDQATPLHGDNEGALTLVKKPAFHQRTKHIEIRWHYIREAQERGDVSVKSIRSAFQTADIFTKSLPAVVHEKHRQGLGLWTRTEVLKHGIGHLVGGSDGREQRKASKSVGHDRSPILPHSPRLGASASGPKQEEQGGTSIRDGTRAKKDQMYKDFWSASVLDGARGGN